VSFDVFLQGFRQGDAANADEEKLAGLLQLGLVETPTGLPELRFDDGDASIYGLEDLASGFMVNHVSGRQVWDALVAVVRAADLAIMPVGYAVAVPSETMLSDLPEELRRDAVVVASGDDLLREIGAA
jgi:hypothetical protein